MQIYFVRHGHPNYKEDVLTDIGHAQAEAASLRLKDSGIERIYASTHGRAMQTAEHTAEKLGLEIIPRDSMREIRWNAICPEDTLLMNGHPWHVSEHKANEGIDITNRNWRLEEPYSKSHLVERTDSAAKAIDELLEELGYKREGNYYRVLTEDTEKTVAVFSHAGFSSAALSHMFNIPFPQFCSAFHIGFASITLVDLHGTQGRLIAPRFIYVDNIDHTRDIDLVEKMYFY